MKTNKLLFTTMLFASTMGYAQGQRVVLPFNSDWKFKINTTTASAASNLDDSKWTAITIPHTWNNKDGQDGHIKSSDSEGDYLRCTSWYRKKFSVDAAQLNKCTFIEFEGVNMQCEVFVNGNSVGTHKGGYTAFRFDITKQLKQGENTIAVKVDNKKTQDICPLTADFTFFGGIYRNVSLITVNPVHISLMNYGSPGVQLTQKNVSAASANLNIKSAIKNDGSTVKTVTVTATLRYPDSFQEVKGITHPRFKVADMMPGGAALATITDTYTINPGDSATFDKNTTVNNPHLWNGMTDPFRYLVDLTVTENGNIIDKKSQYIGFRFYQATNQGFKLNGKSYPLRGVNRHQDRKDMGNAITEKEHQEDFSLIYEIGANALRLAHYPQANYFYDMCDRYGIAVWAEIPFVDHVGSASNFETVTRQQLTELIKQQYNRPSILMWGLQNEVRYNENSTMSPIMSRLNTLAHSLDETRYTVQASNQSTAYNWGPTDLFAWNTYPGWYGGGTLGGNLNGYQNRTQPCGVSEYGAGGNITQHELYPNQPSTTGQWHPEEYQSKAHEGYISDINKYPRIWGTFVWNMFDFASDPRSEGDQPGINDKGLVTYDRKIRKDAFYVYKANWSTEPCIHITSRRFEKMPKSEIPVTVYSNCSDIKLLVNGVETSAPTSTNNKIYKWSSVKLRNGENIVIAKGMKDGEAYADTVKWQKDLYNTCTLNSTVVGINNEAKKIILTTDVDIANIQNIITGLEGATYKVYKSDGETEITSGNLSIGMKLIVIAEDGTTKATFEVYTDHIAYGKQITSDSQQSGNEAKKAIDLNPTTRWAAQDSKEHYLQIDLAENYHLSKCVTTFFNNTAGNRSYKYKIGVGETSETLTTAINATSNTTVGTVNRTFPENTTGRYVRLTVTGSSESSAYPSIYEIEVYGWKLNSSKYSIDETNKIIYLPKADFTNALTPEKLESSVNLLGQGTISFSSVSYFIQENDQLIVTDVNGKKFAYTIKAMDNYIYNGDFTSSKNDDAPAGWISSTHPLGNATGQWHARAYVYTSGENFNYLSIFSQEAVRACFFMRFDGDGSASSTSNKNTVYTYGTNDNYLLTLTKGQSYRFSFDCGAWGDANTGYDGRSTKVSIKGPEEQLIKEISVPLTIINKANATKSSGEIVFDAPSTGNYTINFANANTANNLAIVVTNCVLLKSQSTNIQKVANKNTLQITSGKGKLTLTPFEKKVYTICSTDGRIIYSKEIKEQTTIPLLAGTYLVNNQKFVVY